MKKRQEIKFEKSLRWDGKYGIWKQTYILRSYPIKDGTDNFKYLEPLWVLVDVVIGFFTADERIQELSK